jgi:hypothetical protein
LGSNGSKPSDIRIALQYENRGELKFKGDDVAGRWRDLRTNKHSIDGGSKVTRAWLTSA